MNEIQLSNDLYQIELEINHHKNIAGQSIWEIGRRLNHVKENDLSHGEFSKWLEKVEINQSTANKMMRITKELPNSYTSTNLGLTALDLISSLPQGERTKEHVTEKGETKTPDEMTVRELQKLTKEIKEKDERIANLSETVKEMANQKPEVIEKVVTKEVIPPKYENLESDNQQLTEALKEARERELKAKQEKERIEKEILTRRKIENDDMEQAQLTRLQRSADINVHRLILNMNDFVKEQSITVYDSEAIAGASDETKQKLNQSIKRVENLLKDIKQEIGGNVVWTIN